ncbi:podocan-like [Lissotriton helveticus]
MASMKLGRAPFSMKTCARTFLIWASFFAALSREQQTSKPVTEAEHVTANVNETFPALPTWDKEKKTTSRIIFEVEEVLSTAHSMQEIESISYSTPESISKEDTTSMEILLNDSLLPFTQKTIDQADLSMNNTNVNMQKREQLPNDNVVSFPGMEKDNNVPGEVLETMTNSHLKKVQFRNSGSEDESEKKKTKALLSIIKAKRKDLQRKKKILTKKNKTAAKYLRENMPENHNKGNKAINNMRKEGKHGKQKKGPKSKEYVPYFEDNYCPPECACYGRVVQCSDKGLSKIPYGTPFNARYLLLMNNKIDFIQLDLLEEYLSLEFLVLNNNRLTDGAIEGAFEGMPKLTRLFMEENHLSSFPADLPPSLLELRLNDNNISHISDRAISSCTNLKILSLERNGITAQTIPSGTFNSLKNLQIVRLNFNQLEAVPSNLTTSLKELYLEDNKITSIPNDVFSEPSELESMHLNNNQITNKRIKKKAFRNMTKLETLNMASNLLKAVPKHLPKSLRKLILSGNSITSVKKDDFLKLQNLTQIILSSNKILRIEASAFKGLSSLEHLDVSINQLLEVPRKLPITLLTLFLFNNQIRRIPKDSFCGRQHLESRLILVRLENNKISHTNIDAYALRCLRGFQIVHFY